MATFLSLPVLMLLVMLQSVIVSRIPLLLGTADVVMLTIIAWALHERVTTSWLWALVAGLLMSFVSAVPGFTFLFGYLLVTGITRLLRRRVWQTPILSMLLATTVGTIIVHTLTLGILQFQGDNLPLNIVINQVTLPSVLLNLLLALPIYALVHDLASSLYPNELEL